MKKGWQEYLLERAGKQAIKTLAQVPGVRDVGTHIHGVAKYCECNGPGPLSGLDRIFKLAKQGVVNGTRYRFLKRGMEAD
jgi:hypothetical protein